MSFTKHCRSQSHQRETCNCSGERENAIEICETARKASRYCSSQESSLQMATSAEALGLGHLSLKDKNLVVNLNTGNQIIGAGKGDGKIKQQLVVYPAQHPFGGKRPAACGFPSKEFRQCIASNSSSSCSNGIKAVKHECKICFQKNCRCHENNATCSMSNSQGGCCLVNLCTPTTTYTSFSDGCKYKISSVVDGTVLDVGEEAKVITWTWNKSGPQKWTALREGSGFRLESGVSRACEKLVLDFYIKKQIVGVYSYHGKANQQWVASRVCKRTGAVVISNLWTGTVLRNMGRGQQVKCVQNDNCDDKCTWWYITQA